VLVGSGSHAGEHKPLSLGEHKPLAVRHDDVANAHTACYHAPASPGLMRIHLKAQTTEIHAVMQTRSFHTQSCMSKNYAYLAGLQFAAYQLTLEHLGSCLGRVAPAHATVSGHSVTQ
jgi:hypothetical protein